MNPGFVGGDKSPGPTRGIGETLTAVWQFFTYSTQKLTDEEVRRELATSSRHVHRWPMEVAEESPDDPLVRRLSRLNKLLSRSTAWGSRILGPDDMLIYIRLRDFVHCLALKRPHLLRKSLAGLNREKYIHADPRDPRLTVDDILLQAYHRCEWLLEESDRLAGAEKRARDAELAMVDLRKQLDNADGAEDRLEALTALVEQRQREAIGDQEEIDHLSSELRKLVRLLRDERLAKEKEMAQFQQEREDEQAQFVEAMEAMRRSEGRMRGENKQLTERLNQELSQRLEAEYSVGDLEKQVEGLKSRLAVLVSEKKEPQPIEMPVEDKSRFVINEMRREIKELRESVQFFEAQEQEYLRINEQASEYRRAGEAERLAAEEEREAAERHFRQVIQQAQRVVEAYEFVGLLPMGKVRFSDDLNANVSELKNMFGLLGDAALRFNT